MFNHLAGNSLGFHDNMNAKYSYKLDQKQYLYPS